MKTISTIVMAFFMLINISVGQDHGVAILNQVKDFNSALLSQDYNKYVSLMNPSIIELGGGLILMSEVEKEKMATFSSMGMKYQDINAVSIGDIVTSGNELQTILTQSINVTLGKDSFVKTSYFLASTTDGETWRFVDLEPYDNETINDYIPNFSKELLIEQPSFNLSKAE